MMLAWSFPARTIDEIGRLLRALGKHRYVSEVDHRVHWSVDRALQGHATFALHAEAFAKLQRDDPSLDLGSRDPRLWRPATADEVILALGAFWDAEAEAEAARARLRDVLTGERVPLATHEPFACSPDEPPHPELLLLDWVLYPVDELDVERHAGALCAMEDAGEEVDPSSPIYQEGPTLSFVELTAGAKNGVLADDLIVWSDGPYAYVDYVFRGAAKAAKLAEAPVGYRDI